MFDKLKQQVKSDLDDVMNYLSQKSVNVIIKKEFYKKASDNKQDINKYFKYFVWNYVEVLKYLRNDFKVETIKFTDKRFNIYNKEELNDEIESMKKIYKHYVEHKFFQNGFRQGINLIPIQNTIEKWKILNDIFSAYSDILELLIEKCKCDKFYKEINFITEKEAFKSSIHLKEDFSSIIKMIKQDKINKQTQTEKIVEVQNI